MKKILNGLFFILKWILLLSSFAITFYIILSMYDRVNKNLLESASLFIPYILILILFMVNIILKQKSVSKNLFYNLTCCLVFTTIIVVGIRAIIDKNMVLNQIMGYGINFSYFNDFLSFMKVLLYGLSIGNIFFMIHEKEDHSESTLVKKVTINSNSDSNIEVL
ncbi:MAG: hypothetical protein HFJ12_00190 [Bacilli bacterium]|nr:hypothetical protein [Bacilli bacterium]